MNMFVMSILPSARPSGGIRMSFVNDVTILPNAAPRMTAMARSSTLPRMTNALNSLSIGSGVGGGTSTEGAKRRREERLHGHVELERRGLAARRSELAAWAGAVERRRACRRMLPIARVR